jgi:hypothetical protein
MRFPILFIGFRNTRAGRSGVGYHLVFNSTRPPFLFVFSFHLSSVYIHQYGSKHDYFFASVKLVMQLDKDFPEPEMHSYEKRTNTALKEIAYKNINFSFPAGGALFKNFNETIPRLQADRNNRRVGTLGKTTFLDLIWLAITRIRNN